VLLFLSCISGLLLLQLLLQQQVLVSGSPLRVTLLLMLHRPPGVKFQTLRVSKPQLVSMLIPSMSLSLAQFYWTNNTSLITPMKPDQMDKDVEKSGERLKLKGIIYPGMDLFDSATREKVKMRNQPKDDSVLEQMIATSIEIEPAEISYHANGEFRASRDIYGPISTENTPVRTELGLPFSSEHTLTSIGTIPQEA
jgi:hypothetical protein